MNKIESISISPSTPVKTTPGRFEAALQGAASSLARTVVGAVEAAAPAVPFGTVLVGAVRGGASAGGGAGAGPVANLSKAGGATAFSEGSSGTGGAAGAVATATGGDLLEATRAMQQEAQAMNLQYLQLQEAMQRESREYQALSNVMKVKHDSARAAISNIH